MKRCRIEGCESAAHATSGHCAWHYWFPLRAEFGPVEETEEKAKAGRDDLIFITIDGETRSPVEWSRHPECPVTADCIRVRIRNGIPPREAVFTARMRMKQRRGAYDRKA